MSRDTLKIEIADITDFAANLRKQLIETEAFPSHLSFLGMIARASGYRNFQHLQAQATKGLALPAGSEAKLKRALRVFSNNGKMMHWPASTSIQALCLWPIWFDIARRAEMSEKQVNNAIQKRIDFEDFPLVRRSLIDHKLMTRTNDGRVYTRVSKTPPTEAIVLSKLLEESYRPS